MRICVITSSSFVRTHLVPFCRADFTDPAVVCFVSDYSIIEQLQSNPDEVDHIFTHPLRGCHQGVLEGKDLEGLVAKGDEWWPHEEDFHVSHRDCAEVNADFSIFQSNENRTGVSSRQDPIGE